MWSVLCCDGLAAGWSVGLVVLVCPVLPGVCDIGVWKDLVCDLSVLGVFLCI